MRVVEGRCSRLDVSSGVVVDAVVDVVLLALL